MCNRYTESREYRAELQKALVEASTDLGNLQIPTSVARKKAHAVVTEIMHFDRWSYAHQARCGPCNQAALAIHGVQVG